MSIMLDHDERAELLRILSSRRSELSSEIHHAGTPSFRRELRGDAAAIDQVIAGGEVEQARPLVREVLASYAAALRTETRRTDTPAFRRELLSEAEILQRLQAKLD
jgi:hypothetical protein